MHYLYTLNTYFIHRFSVRVSKYFRYVVIARFSVIYMRISTSFCNDDSVTSDSAMAGFDCNQVPTVGQQGNKGSEG